MLGACSNPPPEPQTDLRPTHLRCEYLQNPLGIDATAPRLSWQLEADNRGRNQLAYRILVASDSSALHSDEADLWDSDTVYSRQSLQIGYEGKPLHSGQDCFWKVQVWDQDSAVSVWSPVARWSMGLLQASDWKAHWIGYDAAWADTTIKARPWGNGMRQKMDYRPLPCPYLRKEFEVDQEVKSAKVYATSLGVYELYINGKRVGEEYLAPGWTDYRKRIYYRTYEVAPLLKPGKNVVAAILSDGWYAGTIANKGRYFYGRNLRLKAHVVWTSPEGELKLVTTDSSWKASYGPLREADMQGGETYDARLEMPGWNAPGFKDAHWVPVVVSDTQTAVLEAHPGPPVVATEALAPELITRTDSGTYIVDMGQNFAGWVRISGTGDSGQRMVIRFAEKLNQDGSLHTRNLRTARCTDTYVFAGKETETFEPRFTYHGFQFLEIKGYPGELTKENLRGIVVHSNLPRVGTFECSNSLINRIYQNILWSQRSNYLEVPTDCPQRDERLGWTGDGQIFMKTASYNMDLGAFFTKWMVDIDDGRFPDGRYPSTAPKVYTGSAAGWAEAGIIIPWRLYELYQDKRVLQRYYPSMQGWMDFMHANKQEEYISTLWTYGDWQNVDSETSKKVLATAYYKRTADLMHQIATVIGRTEDAADYGALSDSIKAAFQRELVQDSGKIEGNTQTAYLLALGFDLTNDSLQPLIEKQLLRALQEADWHLTTGIHGTRLLLPVLTRMERTDLAYRILQHEDYPSWGHHVENGATTIWERWNSFSEEEGFHKDSTNSLNHYAYGAVGEWLFAFLVGIYHLCPGFYSLKFCPLIGGGGPFAKATFRSPKGPIQVDWSFKAGQLELKVVLPPNTTTEVHLPSDRIADILETGRALSACPDIELLKKEKGLTVVRIGSGNFHFSLPFHLPLPISNGEKRTGNDA